MNTYRLAILVVFLCTALPTTAEVIIFNYTAKHRLIRHGNEWNVRHTGQFVIDYDSGYSYQIDTYRLGGFRYVSYTPLEPLEYFRALGPTRNYMVVRGGPIIGLGTETWLQLSPMLSIPMARTLKLSSQTVEGDDLDAIYSSWDLTYSFNKRDTQFANLLFVPADLFANDKYQSYLDRGYIPE